MKQQYKSQLFYQVNISVFLLFITKLEINFELINIPKLIYKNHL